MCNNNNENNNNNDNNNDYCNNIKLIMKWLICNNILILIMIL